MDLRLPLTSRPVGLVLLAFVATSCSPGAQGSLEVLATEPPATPESSSEASSEQLGAISFGNFYSIATPVGWEPSDMSADDVFYTSPNGRSVITIEHVLLADYGLTLDSYLSETISILEEQFGTGMKLESTEPTVLDGEPTTLRIYTFRSGGRAKYALVIAISRASSLYPGGTGTMLVWASDAGNETRDRATFDAIRESYAEYGVDG